MLLLIRLLRLICRGPIHYPSCSNFAMMVATTSAEYFFPGTTWNIMINHKYLECVAGIVVTHQTLGPLQVCAFILS